MAHATNFDWKATSGIGLYPVPLVARLLKEKPRVVQSWLDGYANSNASPIIQRQLPQFGGHTVFGFLDLIEARFIKHFVDSGLSPQSIRKVANKLRDKYRENHPFATKSRFRTDGRRIFMEVVETKEERIVVDLMTDNFVMAPMIERSLFETILYADDLAYRWHPVDELPRIVLDPKIALGKPVVEGKWTTTRAVYNSFIVDGQYADTADEFNLDEESVRQAVEFERMLGEVTLH